MAANTLLQIFIGVQFILIGYLAVLVVRHGYIHFRAPKSEPEPPRPEAVKEVLPPAVKEQLVQSSQAKFVDALNHSAAQLQKDLGVTTAHINNLVMRLATEIVSGELERYRLELAELHKQATTGMTGIRTEVAKHETEIKAKIAKELELEKQRLVQQIDTKLGDAVAAFLLETLQHNVDLGNQGQYLIQMLDEHKVDLIKEVGNDEIQPAK